MTSLRALTCMLLALTLTLTLADMLAAQGTSMLQVNTLKSPKGMVFDDSLLTVPSVEGSDPEKVKQKDFKKGTYRIKSPGHYVLKEDIVFDPEKGELSWTDMPEDSDDYPQLEGYLLGFFAAITIEADNVMLDCDDHEIKMSESFHRFQRFFSIIELASVPFPKGQGPPQFASNFTVRSDPVNARNVTIMNCRLGLSSHHSIHGNDNEGVNLINIDMYDFEVAGISLNGASRVRMDQLEIGPSLKKTFKAGMSQAIFMDHLTNTMMLRDKTIKKASKDLKIKLRGKETKVKKIFEELKEDLKRYVKGKDPKKGGFDISEIVGTGDDLPDGSAVYGLLLHRSGVAINQLGFCADDGDVADKRVKDVRLNNINIYDLAVKVEQVTNALVDGKPVAGPAGDVFQITKAWDPDDCYNYVGNSFTDAQLAVGLLRNEMAAQGESKERLALFFGGSYMPQQVLDWASGELSCSESEAWAKSFIEGTGDKKFACTGDAMNHFNKGAIALRLGFQEDIDVDNVYIGDLDNQGVPEAAPYCTVGPSPYNGLDVRGVSLQHMKDVIEFNVVKEGTFSSTNSSHVFSDLSALQMRGDDMHTRRDL